MIAYKVLKDGKSFHGGDHAWSLPADGVPGDWHEVDGVLSLCSHGFHLTTNPGLWWADGCRVFLAEYERPLLTMTEAELEKSLERSKIVVGRVRLIRPVKTVRIGQWKIEADDSRSSGWSDPVRA